MEQGNALAVGTRLGGYEVLAVLGRGGFGITYRAYDPSLNKVVAIKEYLPGEFAMRTTDSRVGPTSEADRKDYEWGLARFVDEARTLARFDHPHVNRVYRFFEANGTAYMVLEYVEGEVLSARLRQVGPLPEGEVTRLLTDVLSGLEAVHEAGYVHRDIKPGNLMVRPDGRVVILDFGAARQAVGQRSKSITSILTPGYAPIEQYDTTAEDVGPWSDIYALGMVAYRCISGLGDGDLPDAVTRSRYLRKGTADLTPAATLGKGRYDGRLLEGIDRAIRVNEDERPQSIAKWRTVLPPLDSQEQLLPPASSQPSVSRPEQPQLAAERTTASRGRWPVIAGVVALVVAVGGGGYWLGQRTPSEPGDTPETAAVGRQPVEPSVAEVEPKRAERPRELRNSIGMEFVLIEPGAFEMGSPETEVGRDGDETLHTVTISQPFYLGKYEVTQEQWQSVMGNNPSHFSDCGDNCPVEDVSWEEVQGFIAALNQREGVEGYRLPTEAEWEYAARAGTQTAYHLGDDAGQLGEYAWYVDNADSKTHPVGGKPPNPWGLYDMLGNVWEWVQDCWNENYADAPRDGRASESGMCSRRVLRGGSWVDFPWALRSANRSRSLRTVGSRWDSRKNLFGFRIVRTSDD